MQIDIDVYELGKWHPELGSYRDWEELKLKSFRKTYVVHSTERVGLSTGGTLLLATAHKKERPDYEPARNA
jgi:hypothetical protein